MPVAAAYAEGSRFPDTPATTAQQSNWCQIVRTYVRMSTLHQFRAYKAATLAKSVGLKTRQVETLLAKAKQHGFDPRVDLAKDVLRGMACGDIAGVLGTKHDDEARKVFSVVEAIRPDELTEDRDLFRKLHSMFLIDYITWREERKPCPCK